MAEAGVLGMETTTTPYDFWDYNDTEPPPSPCDYVHLEDFVKVFLPTLYSLVFIVGFTGNGLVVCVLMRHRRQTTLTDLCLLNLAVSDLVFLLTLPLYAHYSMFSHWSFGNFMCRLLSTCHNAGFFSSVFFMVVMTLDRYVVIMHAHGAARHRTLRVGAVISAFVWLLSLCVSLPSFVFTRLKDGACLQHGAWRTYDTFSTSILGLAIPLLVMAVCYSRIIPTLVNMRSVKRHRVVKLIINIVVAFFVFWVPFNICNFIDFLLSTDTLLRECKFDANLQLALAVTETFAYSHCCLNPIIYAFVGQKFMKRVCLLLREWTPWIPTRFSMDLADGCSSRKSSVTSSRSADFTATVIM